MNATTEDLMPRGPKPPPPTFENTSSLAKQKRVLVEEFDALTARVDMSGDVLSRLALYTTLAEVAAKLADNARRSANRRTEYAVQKYRGEMTKRYGEAWVLDHATDVRNSASAEAGKDPVFKEHADANEMYNRWSTMYSNLALALNARLTTGLLR